MSELESKTRGEVLEVEIININNLGKYTFVQGSEYMYIYDNYSIFVKSTSVSCFQVRVVRTCWKTCQLCDRLKGEFLHELLFEVKRLVMI